MSWSDTVRCPEPAEPTPVEWSSLPAFKTVTWICAVKTHDISMCRALDMHLDWQTRDSKIQKCEACFKQVAHMYCWLPERLERPCEERELAEHRVRQEVTEHRHHARPGDESRSIGLVGVGGDDWAAWKALGPFAWGLERRCRFVP